MLAISPVGLVKHTTGQSIHDWGQQLDDPLADEWSKMKKDAQVTAKALAGTFLPSQFHGHGLLAPQGQSR